MRQLNVSPSRRKILYFHRGKSSPRVSLSIHRLSVISEYIGQSLGYPADCYPISLVVHQSTTRHTSHSPLTSFLLKRIQSSLSSGERSGQLHDLLLVWLDDLSHKDGWQRPSAVDAWSEMGSDLSDMLAAELNVSCKELKGCRDGIREDLHQGKRGSWPATRSTCTWCWLRTSASCSSQVTESREILSYRGGELPKKCENNAFWSARTTRIRKILIKGINIAFNKQY